MISEKKTSVALKAISYIAKKKANVACLGFAYEPDVPEKLKSMMDTKVKKEKELMRIINGFQLKTWGEVLSWYIKTMI